MIYFFVYIEAAYLKDHSVTLEKLALRRGYEYMEDLPYNDPLKQDGEIVSKDFLWIPALVFYFFSMLWFLSYFKLVFTDIRATDSDES